jgi:hypothetical protein
VTTVCSQIPPRLAEPRSTGSLILVASALALAIVASILFLFNPARSGFYPICLFHKSTGLLCPGCGSLRAMHQLLHGHVTAAMHFNALLVLSLPVGGWFGGKFVFAKLKNKPAGFNVSPEALWCGLVVLLLFGMLRNLPFAQQAWLAP